MSMDREIILRDILGWDFVKTLANSTVQEILNSFNQDKEYHAKYAWLFNDNDVCIARAFHFSIALDLTGGVKNIDGLFASDVGVDIRLHGIDILNKEQFIECGLKNTLQAVIISMPDIWKINGRFTMTDYKDKSCRLQGDGYLITH